MKNTLLIHTDGGARGNPGPAAVGVLVKDESGRVLARFGRKIGSTTNNVAEYRAVIEALEWIKKNLGSSAGKSVFQIKFFLDSTLVVNQLNGIFKIKEKHLRDLIIQVRKLEQEIGGNVSYHYVSREENKVADLLVNQALDSSIG